ncbi:MAG: hypothetical protein AB7F43_03270 [Bacteriovoracia bacterium]
MRIDRLWAIFSNSNKVQGKNANSKATSEGIDNVGDGSNQKFQENQNQEKDNQRQKPADKQVVEKAIEELNNDSDFQSTGIKAQLKEDKEGISVHMASKDGQIIKILTGEEFLRLRNGSTETPTRGKILDQKF